MPWKIQNKGNKIGEVRIYGIISDFKFFSEDTTPSSFQKELDALGDVDLINVYINSAGGGVFAGFTIYNILKRHPALVSTKVDGIAASIAAVILQAGDERTVAKNGTIYVHNPMGCICGYADDLRKYADELDKLKQPIVDSFDKLKISKNKLQELMGAETLMTAREALKMGFVDKIEEYPVKAKVENKNVTFENVSFDSTMFKNFDLSKIEVFDSVEEPKPDNNNENELRDMERRYHTLMSMDNEINELFITNFN